MKIIHIEDRFIPDAGYQLNFYAKFRNPEHELIIITSDSFSLWENIKIEDIIKDDKIFEKQQNLKIIRLPSKLSFKNKHNVWLTNLTGTISEINPDVIFVHGVETYTSIRIFLCKKIVQNYTIFADTHNLYNQFENSIKVKIYYWFIRNVIGRIINKNRITLFYTTLENKKIAEEVYGINSSNLLPFYIGTDLEMFHYDKEERIKCRNEFNIDENTTIIIYTGKHNESKKPHLILDAINLIKDKIDENIHIIFVGNREREYFDTNFSNIPQHKLLNFHFKKFVSNSQLFKYYSMADFAVFPKENTLSALDTQACKLPIIMESDITNDERLKEGGITYKRNNIKDLSEKILLLINDKSLRNKLGENGLQYVEHKYNYKTIIKEIDNKIMNKHG